MKLSMRKPQIKIVFFMFCYQIVASIITQTIQLKNKPIIPAKFNGPDEQTYKKYNYMKNWNQIQAVNNDAAKSYTLKLNNFAYLSTQQFSQIYLTLIPSTLKSVEFAKALASLPISSQDVIVDDQKQQDSPYQAQLDLFAKKTSSNPKTKSEPSSKVQATQNFNKQAQLQIQIKNSKKGGQQNQIRSIRQLPTQKLPMISENNIKNVSFEKYKQSIQKSFQSLKFQLDNRKKNKRSRVERPRPNKRLLGSVQTFGQFNQIYPQNLQKDIIEQVRKYFHRKNLDSGDIEQRIIKYRFKGNLTQLSIQNMNNQDSLQGKSLILPKDLPSANGRLLYDQQSILNLEMDEFMTKINSVDWTCVSGQVRKQGFCGACYAFAAADCISSIMAIYSNSYHIQLSAQDLIDCASNSLAFGCQGGFLQGSYTYAQMTGILDHYNYPYYSEDGFKKPPKKCKQVTTMTPRYKIKNFYKISSNSCKQLMLTIQRHPVSVAITGYSLAFYDKGIYKCNENDKQLNHAVLVVGFKKDVGWKIKNSWGPTWGRDGYFWLEPGNTCQICQLGFFALPSQNNGLQQYNARTPVKTCPSP